jgi:hypothetical protein
LIFDEAVDGLPLVCPETSSGNKDAKNSLQNFDKKIQIYIYCI